MATIFCRDGLGGGLDRRFNDFFYGHPTLSDSRTLRYGDRADPAPLRKPSAPTALRSLAGSTGFPRTGGAWSMPRPASRGFQRVRGTDPNQRRLRPMRCLTAGDDGILGSRFAGILAGHSGDGVFNGG